MTRGGMTGHLLFVFPFYSSSPFIRLPREGGELRPWVWIPAFAGMTIGGMTGYLLFVFPAKAADKGMYFIWDFTQLNVRPHSRVGLLKYKTAPIRHSGAGRNPGGPIPSFRRRPESKGAHSVIPAQAGIQGGPFRHSGVGRNPDGPIPSFRRRPESKGSHSVIPA